MTYSRRWVIVAALLIGLGAVAGLLAALRNDEADISSGDLKTFIIAGTVRLSGQSGLVLDQPCAGTGDEADLRDGAPVTVYGERGETLGVGRLFNGVGTADDGAVACVWDFFVPDVNAKGSTYFVEVTDRGRHLYDTSTIHGRVDLVVQAR